MDMATAELKTKKTKKSVTAFLNTIEDETKRRDCKRLVKLMRDLTGWQPKLWGDAIVGFGDWHYQYDSGREGDFFVTGFSPRKSNLTLYIMPGYQDYRDVLAKLGPHKLGKSCLYIKRLDDVHLPTLKKLIKLGVADMKKRYGKDVR
jgi:hypothetical protein